MTNSFLSFSFFCLVYSFAFILLLIFLLLVSFVVNIVVHAVSRVLLFPLHHKLNTYEFKSNKQYFRSMLSSHLFLSNMAKGILQYVPWLAAESHFLVLYSAELQVFSLASLYCHEMPYFHERAVRENIFEPHSMLLTRAAFHPKLGHGYFSMKQLPSYTWLSFDCL